MLHIVCNWCYIYIHIFYFPLRLNVVGFSIFLIFSVSTSFQPESNGEVTANGSTIAADKKTDWWG